MDTCRTRCQVTDGLGAKEHVQFLRRRRICCMMWPLGVIAGRPALSLPELPWCRGWSPVVRCFYNLGRVGRSAPYHCQRHGGSCWSSEGRASGRWEIWVGEDRMSFAYKPEGRPWLYILYLN